MLWLSALQEMGGIKAGKGRQTLETTALRVGRGQALADLESLRFPMGRHGVSIGSLERMGGLQAASTHSWVSLGTE